MTNIRTIAGRQFRSYFNGPIAYIVVAVFLSIGKLGVQGALTCSASALALAATAQFALRSRVAKAKA